MTQARTRSILQCLKSLRKKSTTFSMDWDNSHKNWPLPAVEDPLYRAKVKMEHHFSTKTICYAMLAMSIIIKNSLSAGMKKAGKGSIIHNTWTKFGEHFFGLFTIYCITPRA